MGSRNRNAFSLVAWSSFIHLVTFPCNVFSLLYLFVVLNSRVGHSLYLDRQETLKITVSILCTKKIIINYVNLSDFIIIILNFPLSSIRKILWAGGTEMLFLELPGALSSIL